MIKNILFGASVLFVLIFSGCSTEIDMYAEYEDVNIVYALADVSDDTTWFKITKAFVGPGNALLIAQNPDSSNYPYKLDASITGKKNGVVSDPIILDTITIHNKLETDTIISDGDTIILNPFYAPDQLMYYAVANLDVNADYTLEIKKNDGEVLSASTGLVDYFSITKPYNRIAFSETGDGSIEWYSPVNGVRFEVSLTFNYSEYAPGYGDTLYKSISWPVGTEIAKNDEGGESMQTSYSGPYFYTLLESELEDIPNVTRWAETVDIKIACGSQVLSTYLDINSGSGTLLDEVPIYSNIDGGTGIFASRHTSYTVLELSTATERVLIEDYDLGFKFKQ
jgi:hypothetical protein